MSEIRCLTAVHSVSTLRKGMICLDLPSRISEMMLSDRYVRRRKRFPVAQKCQVCWLVVILVILPEVKLKWLWQNIVAFHKKIEPKWRLTEQQTLQGLSFNQGELCVIYAWHLEARLLTLTIRSSITPTPISWPSTHKSTPQTTWKYFLV